MVYGIPFLVGEEEPELAPLQCYMSFIQVFTEVLFK